LDRGFIGAQAGTSVRFVDKATVCQRVGGRSVRNFEEAAGVVARDVARGGSNGEEDGEHHSRSGHG
jgi:hypothetical protein